MPGFNDTAARPAGNSCANASVKPSIAHLLAQYGATSASVARPHPELKLTITPERLRTIAGAKWRIILAKPFTLTSITLENSWALICHSGAFLLMTPALFKRRSGGPWALSIRLAQDF